MLPDGRMLKLGWHGLCPRCEQSSIYKPGITLDLKQKCSSCGLSFSENDSADGPAVFLIFILGFSLVPLALILDSIMSPPLWVHGLLWGVIGIVLTVGSLRPLKAYIIALQYKHRPWGDKDE